MHTQTSRILSQFERTQARLPHCSACTPFNHDKTRCTGCRHTGHNRSNCPHPHRETQAMPRTGGIPHFQSQNQPAFALPWSQGQAAEEELDVIPGTQYN